MRGLWIGVVTLLVLFGGAARGQDRPERKTVLIFIDDLHIDFANTPSLRTGLRQATERLLAAERSIGVVSDGTSALLIEPTNVSAPLLHVANRIAGAGLKPSEVANPTPAIAADMARREAIASARLQGAIYDLRPDGVLCVTQRQTDPTGITIPIVITTPQGMDEGVMALLSR